MTPSSNVDESRVAAPSDDPSVMLASARQSFIVEHLVEHGTGRVSDLAQRLNVSDMTIRRDIEALADVGRVERIHGGARLPSALSHYEPGFQKKSSRQPQEKVAIARAALDLITPGMAIGLSAGTTTFALAQLLVRIPNLTIVTNSVSIADLLHKQVALASSPSTTTLIMTGGERTPSDALVGPIAVSSIKQLHLDALFLGVHGAHEKAGLTTPNLLEAETNRVFIEAAKRVVVLADHTKWGMIGMSTIAPLSIASSFITDDQLDETSAEELEKGVGTLILAPGIPVS